MIRRLMIRPATQTLRCGALSSNVCLISMVWLSTGYSAAGYGSIPRWRRSASEFLLTCSCSLSSWMLIYVLPY